MSEHTSNETINRLIDSRDRAVAAWGEVCIERDEWRDLARRMRDCLNHAFKTLIDQELVEEFDRKVGA
jgi:hypothetical protein